MVGRAEGQEGSGHHLGQEGVVEVREEEVEEEGEKGGG